MVARFARARRVAVTLVILFAAFVAAVVPVAAERPNGAGLVVRFEDGSLVYAYVQFDEESISSEELLIRSGMNVAVAPYGGLGSGICMIRDTGCPSDDCFCASYSQPAYFWHFYALTDSGWAEQLSGASTQSVSDGEVDGWSWTAGDAGLPATTIEEIAALNGVDLSDPTPTPTFTPPATATATETIPPPATSTTTPIPSTATPQLQAATSTSTPAQTEADSSATSPPTDAAGNDPATPTSSPTSMASSQVTTSATTTSTSVAPSATTTLAATLSATLGPTTVAVLVPPGGTPVPLAPSNDDGGSASDYAMFGALAAVVVAGGAAIIYRNRKAG